MLRLSVRGLGRSLVGRIELGRQQLFHGVRSVIFSNARGIDNLLQFSIVNDSYLLGNFLFLVLWRIGRVFVNCRVLLALAGTGLGRLEVGSPGTSLIGNLS